MGFSITRTLVGSIGVNRDANLVFFVGDLGATTMLGEFGVIVVVVAVVLV